MEWWIDVSNSARASAPPAQPRSTARHFGEPKLVKTTTLNSALSILHVSICDALNTSDYSHDSALLIVASQAKLSRIRPQARLPKTTAVTCRQSHRISHNAPRAPR